MAGIGIDLTSALEAAALTQHRVAVTASSTTRT
jgi:hypothetical protein